MESLRAVQTLGVKPEMRLKVLLKEEALRKPHA